MRTEYPCETCGVPVFQRTARRKRFCSKACARVSWHRENPNKRGELTLSKSVTVTYTDTDGEQWTTVGYGMTEPEAREDADARLPVWFSARGPLHTYSSTKRSIRASLRKSERLQGGRF